MLSMLDTKKRYCKLLRRFKALLSITLAYWLLLKIMGNEVIHSKDFLSTGLPLLDGLDQHFQATVHFSLTCSVDLLPQQRQFFHLKIIW